MGLFGEAGDERGPVFDAVVGDAEEADMEVEPMRRSCRSWRKPL